jgi:2-polyprenyl-3-methyl-5-hydroxy-6-metoxy-1,4-benzoquinol methylase
MARRLLGRHFHIFADVYRRVFVDMDKVTDEMIRHIPPNARVLDVGGGDGYVVEQLLRKRPDIHVTMTDVASVVGTFISAENRRRATVLAATDVATVTGKFEVMTLADVVHHVPPESRTAFLAVLTETARRVNCRTILIKDIEPGGLRALLALLGDHHITGDKQASPAPAASLKLPGFTAAEMTMPDFPNYCVRFTPAV